MASGHCGNPNQRKDGQLVAVKKHEDVDLELFGAGLPGSIRLVPASAQNPQSGQICSTQKRCI